MNNGVCESNFETQSTREYIHSWGKRKYSACFRGHEFNIAFVIQKLFSVNNIIAILQKHFDVFSSKVVNHMVINNNIAILR